jgi:hypothetical protein
LILSPEIQDSLQSFGASPFSGFLESCDLTIAISFLKLLQTTQMKLSFARVSAWSWRSTQLFVQFEIVQFLSGGSAGL